MEFLKGVNGLYFLIAVTVGGLLIERLAMWRPAKIQPARIARNAVMNFYGIIILGAIPVLSGGGAALLAREKEFGLLNWIGAPLWVGLIAAVVVADILGFFQHRALHQWYFLWRAHRTHHLDKTIDASTSMRFHPLETLFRAFTEIFVVSALGLPPEGIVLSFAVIAAYNVFLHMNLAIPAGLEHAVSRVFLTTRSHRLHHSADERHYNSNFGILFSAWDKLSGTWIGPKELPDDIVFGLTGSEDLAEETFGNLALDPFRRRAVKAEGASMDEPAIADG